MNRKRPKEEILRKSKANGWFILWLDSRVEKQFVNTLGREIIESLGYGRDSRKW